MSHYLKSFRLSFPLYDDLVPARAQESLNRLCSCVERMSHSLNGV